MPHNAPIPTLAEVLAAFDTLRAAVEALDTARTAEAVAHSDLDAILTAFINHEPVPVTMNAADIALLETKIKDHVADLKTLGVTPAP